MSLTVPLSVRIKTWSRDVHVTDLVSDVTFSQNSPGGYDSLNVELFRPLRFTPGEVALFANVYVYGPTGLVWEGRLQDPGRTVGADGEVYSLTAIGGQQHLQDRTQVYVIIDSSLDRLERRQFTTEHPQRETRIDEDANGTPALWLVAPQGTTWIQNRTATMVYPHIRNAGQKLGAYSVAGDCGKPTLNTWKWQTITRSPGGTGTVDRNLDMTTAGIAGSVRVVGTSFPDGDDQLELRLEQSGAATQIPDDEIWCIFAHLTVTCKLMTKAGMERSLAGTGYNYAPNYVYAHEIVEDMLGRHLPELDGANASVATGTYQINQFAYTDGVTPAKCLEDLMAIESAYTWHVWESNSDGKYRFEWVAWPTTVRYEADVVDGFSAPASGNTLYNRVRVRYRDAAGRTRHLTATQSIASLSAAGIDRAHYMDLGDEVGSSNAAGQAAQQFLNEHRAPLNAGRLTVTRPILDLRSGRMVQPWEIKPGELIRVRGVESYPDSLNPSGRDGLTVFKIAATSYSSADAAAQLELDTYAPNVARALAELKKKPAVRRR